MASVTVLGVSRVPRTFFAGQGRRRDAVRALRLVRTAGHWSPGSETSARFDEGLVAQRLERFPVAPVEQFLGVVVTDDGCELLRRLGQLDAVHRVLVDVLLVVA